MILSEIVLAHRHDCLLLVLFHLFVGQLCYWINLIEHLIELKLLILLNIWEIHLISCNLSLTDRSLPFVSCWSWMGYAAFPAFDRGILIRFLLHLYLVNNCRLSDLELQVISLKSIIHILGWILGWPDIILCHHSLIERLCWVHDIALKAWVGILNNGKHFILFIGYLRLVLKCHLKCILMLHLIFKILIHHWCCLIDSKRHHLVNFVISCSFALNSFDWFKRRRCIAVLRFWFHWGSRSVDHISTCWLIYIWKPENLILSVTIESLEWVNITNHGLIILYFLWFISISQFTDSTWDNILVVVKTGFSSYHHFLGYIVIAGLLAAYQALRILAHQNSDLLVLDWHDRRLNWLLKSNISSSVNWSNLILSLLDIFQIFGLILYHVTITYAEVAHIIDWWSIA